MVLVYIPKMTYTNLYRAYLDPDCPLGMPASTRKKIIRGNVSRATLLGWTRRGQAFYNEGFSACPTRNAARAYLPSINRTVRRPTPSTRTRPTLVNLAPRRSTRVQAEPGRFARLLNSTRPTAARRPAKKQGTGGTGLKKRISSRLAGRRRRTAGAASGANMYARPRTSYRR